MRAIVIGPDHSLTLEQVSEPAPGAAEALVRVEAVSLNRGELTRAQSARPGFRPGWDFAGVVEVAAANGRGPQAGTRVAGALTAGAWAERIAAPVSVLAPLPDSVSFATAACLPVAGLTALFALQRGGFLLGRRVLITGANGGVGHLACQIARQAGAHVVAAVRRGEDAAFAESLGAHRVAVLDDDPAAAKPFGPYDLILDSVGGASLPRSLDMLAPEGECVVFGVSGGAEALMDVRDFYMRGSRRISGLAVFEELKVRARAGADLSVLLALAGQDRLVPHVGACRPWDEVAAAASDLLERRHAGKAVLLVGAEAQKTWTREEN